MWFWFAGVSALMLAAPAGAATVAPFSSARTLAGQPFEPGRQVTIVNFWATWCAPCRAEMPMLDTFYRKHRAQGLGMLAISVDQGVSTGRLREVTGQFAFPVARLDAVKMPRRDIPVALPVTRIYDRSGRLVFATKGDGRTPLDAATLERLVTPLLAAP
ncbi:TlpA family protein disulfide reductase [Sphingomonas ginsengisoli (ex An et al. 2013)]|uniref:TlpA family protein disulfide reductase n=2 Tax=Sphingomonas TaxID=13687 RepID=UPI0013B45FBA|nr:TlpA disulfide reductase family protein [Sphingomonas ginsengisoli An et al. 2013]